MILRRLFWVFLYVLSPAIPVSIYYAGNWWSFFHAYSVSMTLGICAYVWFLNQFIVAARPKFFERIYGLDSMYRFHRLMAILGIVAAAAHAVLKLIYFPGVSLQKFFGVASFFLFLIVIVATLLFMVAGGGRGFTGRLAIVSAGRRRWQYHRLKRFHNLVAVAALLVLFHVLLAFSTLADFARIAVMAVWFAVAAAMYGYHKIVKLRRARRMAYTVASIERNAPDVTTVHLSPPNGHSLPRKAGQFAYVRFLDGIPGEEEHPFTISSSPADPPAFTVKNLGDFSGSLPKVRPGARVAIDGPYGVFTLHRVPSGSRLVLIAGGIGITPFLSMLRDPDTGWRADRVDLLWSVRTQAELVFADELEAGGTADPPLTLHRFVTREGPSARISIGYLRDHDLIDPRAWYYLCGPQEMMESLAGAIRAAGVPRRRIRYEAFAM